MNSSENDVVEAELHLTLVELCRVTRAGEEEVRLWVAEGVLTPVVGEPHEPREWRFTGVALRRARVATTLTRELDVNTPGVALALDLMDEIEALKGRLRRAGLR